MEMGRYIHFEHFVDDPEKALAFYSDVFGWDGQQWGQMTYWTITTGPEGQPGINGGISNGPAPGGQKVVNTIGVDDMDDAILRAEGAGATVVVGKQAIPGVGWMAYLTDPTGVVFGVYMDDPSAK
jgi:predicted enzyme related to lactoylglutathione lyase